MSKKGKVMNPIYAVLLIFIICTGICYSVAKKRNAKVSFWVVMGALFGPLAIPFVFFSKPVGHA
jgi:hypothetical protein